MLLILATNRSRER